MPICPHDHVIKHLNLEKLPGADKVTRHLDVCLAGRAFAAGVIVRDNKQVLTLPQ